MAKKKLDVKAAYEELANLAAWFDRGEPDLEAGLEKYERASELVTALQERLREAEQRIRVIRVASDAPIADTVDDVDDSEDEE